VSLLIATRANFQIQSPDQGNFYPYTVSS